MTTLSGVSCPGLIEAEDPRVGALLRHAYPGFLAPASLKRTGIGFFGGTEGGLIRGFLPRPH